MTVKLRGDRQPGPGTGLFHWEQKQRAKAYLSASQFPYATPAPLLTYLLGNFMLFISES